MRCTAVSSNPRSSQRRIVPGILHGSGLLFACLLVLAAACPARASSNNVPDWVKEAAARTVPPLHGTPQAVVLLDDTTYTVASDGKAVEHVRRVVKILRPQGRKYGYCAVWFDKDSKILQFHVWSIDPAGHEYAAKDQDISEYSPSGYGELYSDDKARIADPPGRDPGAIVAFEYEKRERPYLAETNWEFQDELPRVAQRFTLVLPAGYSYTTTWAHHDSVPGADLENHSYRWEMNDQPAIDLDHVPLSPGSGSLQARMTVHYSGPGLAEPQDGTWQGIGEWYDGQAKSRLVATPEITAKAAELTAGKTDFYDKASAIGKFVQKDIRYVAIEIGVGGYQPHAAGDTFRYHYGDCKDKATLMAAMLSTVGIHATLVMVDTERGVIDPNAPSIVGNHMIGAIEIPAGYESPKLHSLVTAKTGKRYLIFDPTWTETPFGQLENNLQASYGVLMDGANSQIIELPVMDPKLNTIRRTAKFELTPEGTLKGEVTDKRFGDLAERRRYVFIHDDAKKQQEYMDHVIAHDFSAASLTGVKVSNADALNEDLTTSFKLEASHYATATGAMLMVRPRVLGSYELSVDRKNRKVPIDLEETMQGTDDYQIELPPGYAVDELPDAVSLDLGFASYHSKTEMVGNTLHYTRTYTLNQVTLPAARYADVQKLAAAIAEDEGGLAILKRNPK